MPDPTLATLSATETPALFGVSPYVTRWMLYQKFAKGADLGSPGDARMNWGKKLQPLVLAQAAEELRLEVMSNVEDIYVTRGQLGCTRDATIICPDRGPGALETKCVFDYGVWMRDWAGGKTPPRHYEIQLQQQMLVGSSWKSYSWGVLAAWVCGEMHYFEREPIPELWAELEKEAARFFDDVKNCREPNAFGEVIEWPLMAKLLATPTEKLADLRDDPKAHAYADDVRAFLRHGEDRLFHEKEEKLIKARLLAVLTVAGADKALLADGVNIELKRGKRMGYTVKPSNTLSLKTYVPGDANTLMAG